MVLIDDEIVEEVRKQDRFMDFFRYIAIVFGFSFVACLISSYAAKGGL